MSPAIVQRKIQLQRLAHVYYAHADLKKAREFLIDFGFFEIDHASPDGKIYYRGYGTEPFLYCASQADEDTFLGAAFVVESVVDLEIAKTQLPNASEIYTLDAPGGGQCVTFKDPVDGFLFHLVHGQEAREPSGELPELPYNFPNTKHRPANKTQRFTKGPAAVHKIGHFGLCVTDYAAMFEFMTSKFNLKPSDLVFDGESGKDVTTFMHLDRGSEWVDHHTIFFFEGPKPHVHHSSFEVHDFDTQLIGHHWLQDKKYESAWGVGRHVMGSQIFDYWYDPSRFILEHYVDGDLVNDETPISRTKAGPGNLHVWGPEVPATFLQ